MKKAYPLLLAIFALFMVSCASTPEERSITTQTNLENKNNDKTSPETDPVAKKPKNPFFEDDDIDAHYDNDDEDEGVAHEWFVGFLKEFWHIVTYPGRAIAHKHD